MKKSVVLALVVSLVLTGLAAADWDFNADFSAVGTNPNGDWTYGMIPDFTEITLGYSVTTLDTSMNVGPDSQNNWWTMTGADYLIPAVYHNYAYLPDLYANPVGMTALHSGCIPGGSEYWYAGVARLTVPADFDQPAVTINGTFFAGNIGATSNLVVLNGSSPAGSVLLSDYNTYGDTLIDLTVNVSPGDTIDFIVGTAGDWSSDTTPLEAVIVAIPEPVTIMLLGLGSLSLLRKRK